MLMSIVAAPPEAQQVYIPQIPAPRLDPLDLALQHEVRSHGTYGVRTWNALNAVAQAYGPQGRTGQRRFRLLLWYRTKILLRQGALHRFGRTAISMVKVARERAVRRKRRIEAGSTLTQSNQMADNFVPNHLSLNLVNDLKVYGETDKTQSVQTAVEVANAARSLARLRRKRWSGWLGETRSYRGMAVLLPGGKLAHVFGVRRGQVVVTNEPDGAAGDPTTAGILWSVVPARDVQVIKSPAATSLGGAKRGCKETFSEAKREAARRNGLMPPRLGRKRGRPRERPPADQST